VTLSLGAEKQAINYRIFFRVLIATQTKESVAYVCTMSRNISKHFGVT